METYHGHVRTPADAIKLFEACRLGLLPRVQRRLSEKERQSIRSGSVFVWDEKEAGMRRWTDGKSWSASRVSGSFLTYREMEGKRGSGFNVVRRGAGKTPDSGRGSDEDPDDGEPDGYRYKVDGLMKQSFSITTSTGQHLHLISYYLRPMHGEPELMQPTQDPSLRGVVPVKGMYPESSMNEAPVPALTRTPMQQPPPPVAYAQPPQQHAPHQPPQGYPPQYAQQPGYTWPPSPVATPPYTTPSYNQGPYAAAPSYPPSQLPPPPPPPPPPSQQHQSQSHHQHQQQPSQHYPPQHPYSSAPHQGSYDRPPLPPLQPPTAGQSKQAAPAPPQAYPPYPSPYLAQPKGPHHESPRSQHLQVQAREAAMIDPRLAAASAPRNSHGPLPVPHYTAQSEYAPGSGTPPRTSVSPPRSSHSEISGANGPPATSTSSGNKASLSALLHHPTPSSSEPNSANPGSNSASSSPRTGAGNVPVTSAQQSRMSFVPSEDKRAIQSLNKKFCI